MGHTFRNAPPLHVLVMRPWIPLLRGFWVMVLGEVSMFMSDMTLQMLAVLFGIYALIDGALALVLALRAPGIRPSWWLTLIGVCGILAGLLSLLWPGLSAHALAYCIAVWAIVVGLGEIAGAIALRKVVANEGFGILGGWIAIVFGLVLMFRSGEGALALIWFIGGFAIIFGILQVAAAYRLRKHIVNSSAQGVFLSE